MLLRCFLFIAVASVSFLSCKEQGCTDPSAANYSASAEKEDGSCTYVYGCNDSSAINFDPIAQFSDGSCIFQGSVVLYIAGSPDCDSLTVLVDNSIVGGLTQRFFSTGVPCGTFGTISLSLDPGSYSYQVQSDSVCAWSGNFSVNSEECTEVPLTQP